MTGLPFAQDYLLGPLTCINTSPWPYSDLAEEGTAINMAPLALAQAPSLGTALSGTGSWTQGNSFITTTADQTAALAPVIAAAAAGQRQAWMTAAWDPPGEAAGTGRLMCPIASVTTTQINCSENINEPSASGVTLYKVTEPVTLGGNPDVGIDLWITENPQQTWDYYDVAIALYRLYWRTGNSTYLTQARQYADIKWQWTLDHGYRVVAPRASAMLGQFMRALDGHPERFPGLYQWISDEVLRWRPTFCPYCDVREAAYENWNMALGARTDPDSTRHTQYCSWLTTYIPQWNTSQQADGSWGSRSYPNNFGYVDAPKSYTLPIVYESSPWRDTIAAKALETGYDVMADTSSTTGCSQPSIAATALTNITNFINWQRGTGRDSVSRGTFYEVNSMSRDQETDQAMYGTGSHAGTVTVNVASNVLTGNGTSFVTNGYAGFFIGFRDPNNVPSVYQIASCSSNTSCLLNVNFGFFGETVNLPALPTGVAYDIAPSNTSSAGSCNSSALYCFGTVGDRNLTRVECGAIAWLYDKTRSSTYLNWATECISASLGGPTAGLNSSTSINSFVTPAAGPFADGYVTDSVAAAAACGVAPCIPSPYIYSNLGKNYGETWGAPGIDNAIAWIVPPAAPAPVSPARSVMCGSCIALYSAPPEPQIMQRIHQVVAFLKKVFLLGTVKS